MGITASASLQEALHEQGLRVGVDSFTSAPFTAWEFSFGLALTWSVEPNAVIFGPIASLLISRNLGILVSTQRRPWRGAEQVPGQCEKLTLPLMQ